MDEILSNSYSEVLEILNILGKSYKNKISKDILINMEKNKNDKYKPEINDTFKFSRQTIIIISLFNLKYWEKDQNKINKLNEIYANNEKIYQEKINAYKDPNWLNNINEKNRNEALNDITLEENSKENIESNLVIIKKESLFEKIKKYIFKLLKK